MTERTRIRIALQKSGRLSEKSLDLLRRCGLDFEWSKDRLFSECKNFPLDVLLVRDDDIPEYVVDGVCELGIVGKNMLAEKILGRSQTVSDQAKILKELDFGFCRLTLATPKEEPYSSLQGFQGKRIATSYPASLRQFLQKEKIDAEIIELSGSVEIAPTLKIADAICDLVSTGATLRTNGLKEVVTVLESQSVLVQTRKPLSDLQQETIDRLKQRVDGVLKAEHIKYIMMNAPKSALDAIKKILPGMEAPTVIPLTSDGEKIAIHAVARENIFWDTMEKLKKAGASSILVVPIEKIIE